MRILAFIMLALALGAGPASAWEEYDYPDQGVAIQFPAKPQGMKSTYNSIFAKGLPSMVYSTEDDHVRYQLTVIDLSNRPDMGASFLNEAAYWLMREGNVLFTEMGAACAARSITTRAGSISPTRSCSPRAATRI